MALTSIMQSVLAKYPQARALARKARFALWKGTIAARAMWHRLDLDPFRVLWVDPRRIEYVGVG
jgi:hypothetical protein